MVCALEYPMLLVSFGKLDYRVRILLSNTHFQGFSVEYHFLGYGQYLKMFLPCSSAVVPCYSQTVHLCCSQVTTSESLCSHTLMCMQIDLWGHWERFGLRRSGERLEIQNFLWVPG